MVTDKDGRFVSELARERFTVFDNGRPVPVELFSNEDTPVSIGLVIDASTSMRTKLAEVVAAALRFATLSNPHDELFAIRFNDDVRHAVHDRRFLLASDRTALEAALTSLVPEGRTALYDALVSGIDHLAEGSRPRKVLIAISDGGDNASQATLDRVLARARASNATIYTIGLFEDDDPDKNPGVSRRWRRQQAGRASCRVQRVRCWRRANGSRGRSAAVTPSATSPPTATAGITVYASCWMCRIDGSPSALAPAISPA